MSEQVAEPLKRPRIRPPMLQVTRTSETEPNWHRQLVRRIEGSSNSQWRVADKSAQRATKPTAFGGRVIGLPKFEALYSDTEEPSDALSTAMTPRWQGSRPASNNLKRSSKSKPLLFASSAQNDSIRLPDYTESTESAAGSSFIRSESSKLHLSTPESTALVSYRPPRPTPDQQVSTVAGIAGPPTVLTKRNRTIKVVPIKGVMVYKTGIRMAFGTQNGAQAKPKDRVFTAHQPNTTSGADSSHEQQSAKKEEQSVGLRQCVSEEQLHHDLRAVPPTPPLGRKRSPSAGAGHVADEQSITHKGRKLRCAPVPTSQGSDSPAVEKQSASEANSCKPGDSVEEDDEELDWYTYCRNSMIDRLLRKQKMAQKVEQANFEWENYARDTQVPLEKITPASISNGSYPRHRRKRSVRFRQSEEVREFHREEPVEGTIAIPDDAVYIDSKPVGKPELSTTGAPVVPAPRVGTRTFIARPISEGSARVTLARTCSEITPGSALRPTSEGSTLSDLGGHRLMNFDVNNNKVKQQSHILKPKNIVKEHSITERSKLLNSSNAAPVGTNSTSVRSDGKLQTDS